MFQRHFCLARTAAITCAAILNGGISAADEPGPCVHAERKMGDKRVRVIRYEEKWSQTKPQFADNWRSVLCVEVFDAGTTTPRRVWQRCVLGKQGFPEVGLFVLSDPHDGRFAMAYSDLLYRHQVMACVIAINGTVAPLPAEMRVDRDTGAQNWKDSTITATPDFGDIASSQQIAAFWKAELGVAIKDEHRIWLKSVSKISTGWRIDAGVMNPYDMTETRLPSGAKLMYTNQRPLIPFALLLDEDCKSATVKIESTADKSTKSK